MVEPGSSASKAMPRILRKPVCAYASALVATILAYSITLIWIGQLGLSVAIAVLACLLSVVSLRAIQTRGQLSLRVMVVAMPLVMAVACVIWQRLSPYRQRQLSWNALRDTAISAQARSPDEAGEWVLDRSGNIMPRWFLLLVGKNSLDEIHSLDGSVKQFQSLNLDQLRVPGVRRVTLSRWEDEPTISLSLIDWLNRCEKLEYLKWDLNSMSAGDIEALKRLETSRLDLGRFAIRLNGDKVDDDVDLSLLPRDCLLTLDGRELMPVRARQLARHRWILLNTQTLSADALRQWNMEQGENDDDRWVTIQGCTFDRPAAEALTEISGTTLSLIRCQLPAEFPVRLRSSNSSRLWNLGLDGTTIPADLLIDWVRSVRPSSLSITGRPSDDLLLRLREISSLQHLKYRPNWGAGWERTELQTQHR